MNDGNLKVVQRKEFENSESRGDDIRVETKEFLDVISKAIEGVVEEDLGEKDRIRAMVSRLLAVEIDEEEDLKMMRRMTAQDWLSSSRYASITKITMHWH